MEYVHGCKSLAEWCNDFTVMKLPYTDFNRGMAHMKKTAAVRVA